MEPDGGAQRRARVFNLQKYNMYDGPGVRSMAFFKGCPLRCRWCSNPESQAHGFEVMFKASACVDCGRCAEACPVGIHTMEGGTHRVGRSVPCTGCRRCERACPQRALEIMGRDLAVEEVLDFFDQDADFYRMSGGGVTLSGGEVLSQPEAACALLAGAQARGYHTAIETCGYAPTPTLLKVAAHVDLFLFDIKLMDPVKHRRWVGADNELILTNVCALLDGGFNVRVRMPLLKGVNDSEDEIRAIVAFFEPYRFQRNFDGVDLLPYHRLGVGKYAQLGREYAMEGDFALGDDELDRIGRWIQDAGFSVSVVRH